MVNLFEIRREMPVLPSFLSARKLIYLLDVGSVTFLFLLIDFSFIDVNEARHCLDSQFCRQMTFFAFQMKSNDNNYMFIIIINIM